MGRCRAGVGRWREAVRSMSPNTEEVAPQERQRPQGSRYQVVPAGSFRDLEGERSAAQQHWLAEEAPQFLFVERDSRRSGDRPRAGSAQPAHVEREHPTAGDSLHLAAPRPGGRRRPGSRRDT